MIACPQCGSQNRSGAKFCKSCGKDLAGKNLSPGSYATVELPKVNIPQTESPAQELATAQTLAQSQVNTEPQVEQKDDPQGDTAPVVIKKTDTQPIRRRTDTQPLNPAQVFTPRPTGAVLGDRFMVERLVFSTDSQHQYVVSQVTTPGSQKVAACSNPECGAVFTPLQDQGIQFCTDCGTPLDPVTPDLLAVESHEPLQTVVADVIQRGLVHGGVRAPLEQFEENVVGLKRYVYITPRVTPMPESIEPGEAMKWAITLAAGLHYLHENGITFGGKVQPACFGIARGKAVWADFSNCTIHPDMLDFARPADVRALAGQLYLWMTGKEEFTASSTLTPAVSQVFEKALSNAFETGMEFAEALALAAEQSSETPAIDYTSGRLTNVGMVRSLNEDSILSIEFSRTQQGICQPIGVYVVADGMGGHAAGEIASTTIVNTIAARVFAELNSATPTQDRLQWLTDTVQAANTAVFEMRKAAGTDMGSTVVVALVEGNKAYLAHAGDSRIYFLNGQEIRQVTTDHSLVERLIATGQITREEARTHPQRNVVYRTVGDKPRVDLESSVLSLAEGDMLLLCSDGLSGMIDDANIFGIVTRAACPQDACVQLIEAANSAGGDDNISAILVKVAGLSGPTM